MDLSTRQNFKLFWYASDWSMLSNDQGRYLNRIFIKLESSMLCPSVANSSHISCIRLIWILKSDVSSNLSDSNFCFRFMIYCLLVIVYSSECLSYNFDVLFLSSTISPTLAMTDGPNVFIISSSLSFISSTVLRSFQYILLAADWWIWVLRRRLRDVQ